MRTINKLRAQVARILDVHVAFVFAVLVGASLTILPVHAAERIYYYHTDHLGKPEFMTDESQNLVWQASNDPFGAGAPALEIVENNLRFPGQYFDQETGLHYNWNRYHNPETGRYIASDPIGLAGGLNTYLYAEANPSKFIDPLGLAIWNATSILEASAAIGVGASFFNIELESACFEGKKHKIEVRAVGPAAGLELRCKFCFTLPVKFQLNAAQFDDHSGSDRPDPRAFNGPFLVVGASGHIYGVGGGVGDILLGRATNVGSGAFNLGAGTVGVGFSGAIGTSTVVDWEIEECSECE